MKGIKNTGKAFLITIAVFLFSSWNVSAQENTVETLWSATMTVGSFYSLKDQTTVYGYYGASLREGDGGSLTNDTFTYNGNSHQVYELQRIGNIIVLGFRGSVFSSNVVLRTDSDKLNRTYYLNIGDSVSLDFRDRSIPTAQEDEDYGLHETESRRRWLNQSSTTIPGSVGETIEVSITTKVLDGGLELSDNGTLTIFDDSNNDGTGHWRHICDDDWDNTDAQVACNQLGLSESEGQTKDVTTQGNSSEIVTFLLDEVECDGTEDRVIDCDHDGRNTHDCASWEIAGATCTSS